MDLAGIDVREKIDLLQLPLEASRPILLRFDPSTEPVMRYAFVDTRRVREVERRRVRRRRAAEEPAPLRRRPPQARPRVGRRLRGGQGQRRLRGRDPDLRGPAEAGPAQPVDRHHRAAPGRGERQPLRGPARAGHAALPGADAQRVHVRAADGGLDHRERRGPAGVPARRRHGHQRLQGPRGDHAREWPRVRRARRLQGRRRQHGAARRRHPHAHRGARQVAAARQRDEARLRPVEVHLLGDRRGARGRAHRRPARDPGPVPVPARRPRDVHHRPRDPGVGDRHLRA